VLPLLEVAYPLCVHYNYVGATSSDELR